MNKGIFNIYNQTAAMAFLCELGYSREDAAGAVAASSFTKTRLDEEEVNGVKVQTMLCKGLNGYAASRVLEYIRTCDGPKEFVIMTNSLDAEEKWSEDICWIYDCDVEFIADDTLEQIIVHGARGKDYRVRLLYAGIPAEKITLVETSEDSIDKLKLKKGETVFVLYDLDVIDRGLMVAEKIKDRLRGEGGAR